MLSRADLATHAAVRLTVSLPVSLVAGLGAGFAFFRGPAPLTPAAAAAVRAREVSTDAAAWPDSPAATDAKAQRLIAAALRKGRRLERQDEMYRAIEALTADDFRRLVTDFGAVKAMAEKLRDLDWETSRALASGLIARWLAVDPGTVMTWAPRMLELIPQNQNARGLILDTLAAKRPAELLALVPACKDAAERADLISRALRELAARDLPQARAWLAGCTEPADRRVAEKAVRLGTVQGDPLSAVGLAAALTNNRIEAGELLRAAAGHAAKIGTGTLRAFATTPMEPWMVASVASVLAEREPELGLDLALKIGPDAQASSYALQQGFGALAARDPAQAVARLENLTAAQLTAAVSGIGNVWVQRDPAAAVAWLAQRSPAERANPSYSKYGSNDTLLSAFGQWAEQAQGDAGAWAAAQPEGATRDALQTRLAQVLADRGQPAEAVQLLARFGSAANPKAVASVAEAWARSDPLAAADWAIAQEPGPAQNSALAGIVSTWANDNPRGVEDWLAQFPAGEARDRSVAAFLARGSSWSAGSAEQLAEFDAWFGLIDDPLSRAQAAVQSFWRRKERDPAGARAWLAALPNLDPEVVRITLRDDR